MEKKHLRILQASGLVNVFFLVFHVLFYGIFGWEKSLACLSRFDWAIFMTYHAIVILAIGAMAVICLFYARYLLQTALGKPVLVFFALFYIVRIAAEFLFFGYSGASSVYVIVMCLLPVAACLDAFAYNLRFLKNLDVD